MWKRGPSQHSPLAQDTSTDPAISSYSVPFHQWKGAVRCSTCHTWLFLALCLYSCMGAHFWARGLLAQAVWGAGLL